jgi:hypothetical protein
MIMFRVIDLQLSNLKEIDTGALLITFSREDKQ